MQKIAFHTQKGGVGKTTLSTETASLMAQAGVLTVLVDCDPQGNASTLFLKNADEAPEVELADVLAGQATVQASAVEVRDNLYLIPTFGIGGELKEFSETKLAQSNPRAFEFLVKDLEAMGAELVIFDLSPGMGTLEKFVLAQVDEVLTPLFPEFLSLDGVAIFASSLDQIRKANRVNIIHSKIVINNLNMSLKNSHGKILEEFRALSDQYDIFEVPQDSKLKEAQAMGLTLGQYDPENKRALPALEALALALGMPQGAPV